MDKNEITPVDRDFLQGVSDVLAKARKNAKTAFNLSMVYALSLIHISSNIF